METSPKRLPTPCSIVGAQTDQTRAQSDCPAGSGCTPPASRALFYGFPSGEGRCKHFGMPYTEAVASAERGI